MKILRGTWKGKQLSAKPNPKLRPTGNKLREAIFDILESRLIQDWANYRILDLFAGTGAFGLEALSRGAARADFVDIHLPSMKLLRQSVQNFEIGDRVDVYCKGALEAIPWLYRQNKRYELIFLDPPYRQDWVVATLNRLQEFPILSSKGIVVAEHDKKEGLSSVQGAWDLLESRRYGDSAISMFCTRGRSAFWAKKR